MTRHYHYHHHHHKPSSSSSLGYTAGTTRLSFAPTTALPPTSYAAPQYLKQNIIHEPGCIQGLYACDGDVAGPQHGTTKCLGLYHLPPQPPPATEQTPMSSGRVLLPACSATTQHACLHECHMLPSPHTLTLYCQPCILWSSLQQPSLQQSQKARPLALTSLQHCQQWPLYCVLLATPLPTTCLSAPPPPALQHLGTWHAMIADAGSACTLPSGDRSGIQSITAPAKQGQGRV
ncbi:hypothetical protein V8C86DRAFT_2769955 [Haematococcus lacustris]